MGVLSAGVVRRGIEEGRQGRFKLGAGIRSPGGRREKCLSVRLAGETPESLRTPAFNGAAVHQIEATELPPGTTAEDLYRMIHGEDA